MNARPFTRPLALAMCLPFPLPFPWRPKPVFGVHSG